MELKLKKYWHKVPSNYKPQWITDNLEKGWNGHDIGDIIDSLLYDSADVKFNMAYEIEVTITLKEIKKVGV